MPSYILPSIPILLCIGYFWYRLSSRRYVRLPPGPPSLPIIGNLHQLTIRDPWKKVNEWHERYGPIICFRIGPYPVIVIASFEACREIFDKRGRIYSSRPQLSYIRQLTGGLQPLMMPYNSELKKHRQIYRAILDPTVSKKYRAREEDETCRLLYDILASDNPRRVMARYTPSLAALLAYGERISDWGWVDRVERQMHEGIRALVRGGALVDAIPALDWLPEFLSPWKSTAHRLFRSTLSDFDVKARAALECRTWNWTRAIREKKQADSLSWEQFCYTTGELFEGAFITTSSTLGVFMMICATQLDATRKTSDELQHVIGPDRLPTFEDLSGLPCLCAYVKEVLRWRPVTPLGGPHVVTEDDEYNGYFIPANTTVLGNVWALHMDREVFADPETFRPERWIESPGLPLALFGFGRRICPGQHVASDIVAITIARLLWAFEMTSSIDPRAIDTESSTLPGVVFRAPELDIRFRSRSLRHNETIERAWAAIQR